MRAGRIIRQFEGYSAFIPAPLPPRPPLQLDVETLVSINMVKVRLRCGFPTARKYIEQFVAEGILRETTGQSRNRRFRNDPYLSLFGSPGFVSFTQVEDTNENPQMTRSEGERPS